MLKMLLTIRIPNILAQCMLLFLPVFFLFSCSSDTDNKDQNAATESGITSAKGFDIAEYENYRLLSVYNPWQGAQDVLINYILTGRDTGLPQDLPEGTIIRTPVTSIICLSTTHIALLDFIDETSKIVAVSGKDYIYNPGVRIRIDNNEIPDIGYDSNLDYERILELNPDVILAYGVGSESSAWLNRLRDLGMTVVMIGEYLEDSPLAQAEWVKFTAHLFDKQEMASEKFGNIENQYRELINQASVTDTRPVVMSGLPWRNNWFVPGGRSNFATLVSDAGGQYLWHDNRKRENHAVDIENVIEKGLMADFWVNTGTALSKEDIRNIDTRLTSLRPFRLGNIYNNNARINRFGGNDYWESGIVNPHLILKDLIAIMHPGLIPGHELVYYRKL
jgi:iron complex transport system substrate-binding protein